MPAARRLGLDEATVRAVNPDIVYCHASSYGPQGARADWPGYDQLFQSSCGWEVAGAGEGNDPMWHRLGFMDHMCAMGSLISTLLALYHRDRTGETQFVAGSLLAGGVMTGSETYLDANGEIVPVAVLDHEQTGIAPGYRIAEVTDGWIAVAATTDDAARRARRARRRRWSGRCRRVGQGHGHRRARPRSPTPVCRASQVRLDQGEPFFASTANDAAGLIARYEHVDYGRRRTAGRVLDLRRSRREARPRAPGLGEHTVEVLTEVGLDVATVDALLASGAALAWKATTPA